MERERPVARPGSYAAARSDPLLAPVFGRVADWEPHIARVCAFWSSVARMTGRYHGDPFSTHLRLPDLEPAMFDRWLALFGESCAELFEPELAAALRGRAERIACSLRMGLFERLPAAPARVAAAPPASS